MKFLVFGATGPSGTLLVRKALAAGHEVTVFVRDPERLAAFDDANLTVVAGKLTDPAGIRRAIIGQDAVISLLGPMPKTKGTPIADGMRHIVAAMEQRGVDRLIAVATASVAAPEDRPSMAQTLAVQAAKAFNPGAVQEVTDTAAVIRSSSLAWTLVRLPKLTDKPATAPAFAGYLGDPSLKRALSREALAGFLLEQLVDKTWVRKSPAVSNA